MKLMTFALTAALLAPSLSHATACENKAKKIIEEIGAIAEVGDDEIDAKAAVSQTCMDRYQNQKNFSFDKAFDVCVNRIQYKCKETSTTL